MSNIGDLSGIGIPEGFVATPELAKLAAGEKIKFEYKVDHKTAKQDFASLQLTGGNKVDTGHICVVAYSCLYPSLVIEADGKGSYTITDPETKLILSKYEDGKIENLDDKGELVLSKVSHTFNSKKNVISNFLPITSLQAKAMAEGKSPYLAPKEAVQVYKDMGVADMDSDQGNVIISSIFRSVHKNKRVEFLGYLAIDTLMSGHELTGSLAAPTAQKLLKLTAKPKGNEDGPLTKTNIFG